MSIAASLRLLWLRGLVDCTGHRVWTTDRLFQPKFVTVSSVSTSEFTVYVGNANHSVHYFAHEADRFAAASFESLLSGARSDAYPRATGWLLIRSYYAAFFAVHSLLRLHGWACTRLTSGNLKTINADIQLLFGAERFGAGLYLIKSANSGRELVCTPLDASLGGTHEALWSLLRGFFAEAEQIALAAPDTGGQDFAALVADFFTVIDPVGGPGWFSTVRNRLNYAHEYGAWFPYVNSTCDYDRLTEVLAKWRGSPSDSIAIPGNDDLIKFACACAFLVSLCGMTIRDLTYRSKSNSPFRRASGLLA